MGFNGTCKDCGGISPFWRSQCRECWQIERDARIHIQAQQYVKKQDEWDKRVRKKADKIQRGNAQ